jgi:hypothetical protein
MMMQVIKDNNKMIIDFNKLNLREARLKRLEKNSPAAWSAALIAAINIYSQMLQFIAREKKIWRRFVLL